MKKIFSAFFIAAALATAFSCSKIEPVPGEVHTVTFNATSPATKTTFGALSAGHFPTYWTTNDSQVKVAQNFSDGVDAAVTRISDTDASFDASFTVDGSGSYTFYAISPASAVVSGVSTSNKSWNLEIPTTQTSTPTGPDESAMILAAKSSTSGSFPDNVDLSFKHITAYVNMSITNLALADGDEVASVLVTADANIAYRYHYYVSGAKAGTLEESSGQNAITVITDHADNIWFACAPMASGTELTIAVTTTHSKVYTKVVNTPAALAAGHVASFEVDFAGITPPAADVVYNLVTSYTELTAGSQVIIAAVGSTAFAAGIGTTSDNYISAVSQAKSSGNAKIINPAATVDVFTIEAGGTANTIALNGTNGYLYAKSTESNQMGIQTSNNVNGYWSPTIVDAETGEMSLVATGSSNRNHMHYNSEHSRFSCYASTSSLTDLQALYKLEGSGSGPALVTAYTITYNGNGNTSGSVPVAVVTTGSFTVAAEGDLEKSGYSFTGWNTAADGSGTPYAVGAQVVPTANMTLYAQWSVPGGTFTKVSGELTSGWYVFGVVESTTVHAINNTVGTSWIKYTDVTATANVITNPADAVVWYYDATTGTIKNKDNTNYIYWTSGNVGCCGPTSYAHTITEASSGIYTVKSQETPSRILRRNGTDGYRYYTTSAGSQDICFFKQDSSSPSTHATVVTGGADAVTSAGATLHGSFSGAKGTIAEAGFEYATSAGALDGTATHVFDDSCIGDVASGIISYSLTSLATSTTYYYRAFVSEYNTSTSSYEYHYGPVRSFTTLGPGGVPASPGWLELPAVTGSEDYFGWFYGSGSTLGTNRNYSYNYSYTWYASLWVAYPLCGTHKSGSASTSGWHYNPDVDDDLQVNIVSSSYSTMYNAGSYSRGHQCPSASRKSNSTMNYQTNYATNQTPQLQNKFNASIWSALENAVRGLVSSASDTVYVVTGPAYNKVGESESITYLTGASASANPASLAVPNYYWKALLKVKRSGGEITGASAIAFWFDHKNYDNSDYTLHTYSVDQIEEWTGFDLFANLPVALQTTAEANTSWAAFQSF